MQRKKDEEETDKELRMQEKSESTLLSVEEHKENLQKTVHRMEECKEDFQEYLKARFLHAIQFRIKAADQQVAMRKVKQDKQLITQRQENLRDLDEEISELTEERDHLEKCAQKYVVYSHYMDTFVQATKMEAQRVMSRFRTLVVAREHLRKTSHQGQERIQDARVNLDSVTKERGDAEMQLNSAIAQYQRQLDEAQQNLMHWDSTWIRIQKTAAEQTIFFGKIRMACFNLYRNVCERSRYCRECPVHSEDTAGQLKMIEAFITQWMKTLKMTKTTTSQEEQGTIKRHVIFA
ncbi:hypothetical protein SKAU_G00172720 [Synaphobranchus kaupii]|uniref:Uncharacterized protein n=1 Tax=Synaphobranchus kaupii TaxID=118154 RepID=A0A9Q1FL89_SYNKA|nr:hypothetical protein SKAU_G00172720 [Synaphobranchus kaupii]